MDRQRAFVRLAWATLAATLAVILWGAYVRASGSGAGCGSHWPLCNGEVVPRTKSAATLVELTHRVTSGLAFLMVAAQLVLSRLAYPKGHGVRRGAVAAMAFMVLEAGIGAGLVLLELVAGNKSVARVVWMSAHLVNTFLLLASLAITLACAHGRPFPRLSFRPRAAMALAAVTGVLLVGVAGAIVALGDTLFPARSLGEGLAQDFGPGAHFLVRLRTIHPVLAVSVGTAVLVWTRLSLAREADDRVRTMALTVNALFALQVVIGVVNLVLLAPIALQIVHLLVADLYWLAMVGLAVTLLSSEQPEAATVAPAHA